MANSGKKAARKKASAKDAEKKKAARKKAEQKARKKEATTKKKLAAKQAEVEALEKALVDIAGDAALARQQRRRGLIRRLIRFAAVLLVVLIVGPPLLVAVYRDVDPPYTILMGLRLLEGEGHEQTWVPYEHISRHVPRAVIALEDNTFCDHDGFDWAAIFEAAADQARGTAKVRGGSTITQQTAKNVFLWPGRNFIRKGLEVPFTAMIEFLWGKRRIMEVYLNVIEWGHGIYGIEAAAWHYFNKPAARLSQREAALLASILPNPRRWSASRPTRYIQRRASMAQSRIDRYGYLMKCVR